MLLSILSAQNPGTSGQLLLDGEPIWENAEVFSHIYFAREIITSANSNSGGLKVKEYLNMAASYLPHWDKEMAERLVKLFHLEPKQRNDKAFQRYGIHAGCSDSPGKQSRFHIFGRTSIWSGCGGKRRVYQLLLEEFTETGRTFVISTHIIEEAADIFEEVIFLHHGKIILKENTQELLEETVYVSGRAETVDEQQGKEIYKPKTLGRSKSVLVRLQEGVFLSEGRNYHTACESPENFCKPLQGGGKRMNIKKTYSCFSYAGGNIGSAVLLLGAMIALFF